MSQNRNLNLLPYRWTRYWRTLHTQSATPEGIDLTRRAMPLRLSQQGLPRTLGLSNPRSTYVHVEPCPTSVSKGVLYPVHALHRLAPTLRASYGVVYALLWKASLEYLLLSPRSVLETAPCTPTGALPSLASRATAHARKV